MDEEELDPTELESDKGPVDSGVEENLDEVLETLDPGDSEPAAEPGPAAPDVGDVLEQELTDLGSQPDIGPAETFGKILEPDPPEVDLDTGVTAADPGETLLEHFEKLVEGDAGLAANEEFVDIPETVSAQEEALGGEGGGRGEDAATQNYLDTDYRAKDTMAGMLIDHTERLREILDRLERVRL